MSEEEESLMSLDDVAKYLRLNRKTVEKLVKSGGLPSFKVGRQWRFRKSEIDGQLEREREQRRKETTM